MLDGAKNKWFHKNVRFAKKKSLENKLKKPHLRAFFCFSLRRWSLIKRDNSNYH